jgi:ABC-type dipeptide/oligopeptide/nickel transport system permease subunit
VGISAALIAVVIGVTWGAMSGLTGGRVDSAMMRTVDVLYGLPYILLVVLVKIALQPPMKWMLLQMFGSGPGRSDGMSEATADQISAMITLLLAIGGVSWLTMARVIRGQVLSLRSQPFIEAARACGVSKMRILRVHLLPNLVGPIVVYTTLTVPTAILQESFLSFLGIGVQPPLPSWGNLAAEGVKELHTLALPGAQFGWWLMLWPCLLLALTLLSLNFLGDALRNRLDPRRLKT